MPPKSNLSLYAELAELLLKSYEQNSILQKKKARNDQIVIEKQLFPAKSKPIIDKIDRVLAQHYRLHRRGTRLYYQLRHQIPDGVGK